MSNLFAGVDFDRWYNVWIALSLVVLVACIAGQERVGAIIATGSLLFGMGELKSHPRREAYLPDGSRLIIRTRLVSPFGLLLDVMGIGLAGFGIYKAFLVA